MRAKLIQYATVASGDRGEFRWLPVGMGYILVDDGGRCIAIDGGNPEDAEGFVRLIEEHSPTSTVDLWILTHPHPDHYGALAAAAAAPELRSRIIIGRLALSIPAPDSDYASRREEYGRAYRRIQTLCEQLGCEVITPRTGDTLRVGDMNINILFTQAELPEATDPNELSLIFNISAGGARVLFTGDTYRRSADLCAERQGAALKCDICQLAHHALNGGSESLYALAAPRICLISTAMPAYEAMLYGSYRERESTRSNRLIMQATPADMQIISACGTKILLLEDGNISF